MCIRDRSEELEEHCGVCGEGEGIEEGKPPRKLAQRDVGMECQECGKKFRAKLSTLQYGKTKCPKCKSTDLDFAYGESVEVGESTAAYAKSLEKIARDKQLKMLTKSERDNLIKIAALLAKERKLAKEDTDKDEPGTQGDQAEYQKKREEIAAKFGVKSCSELEGEKKKACYAALDAAHVSDDEEGEEKKEEVEIDEEVTAMDYDRLKRGDIITIEFKSAMSSGKSKFKVTAKNIVGKAKVGKVTLQSLMNPKGVKHFLYKRGNKVSFAQGDMGASVVRYTVEETNVVENSSAMAMAMSLLKKKKEGVEIDEISMEAGKVYHQDTSDGKMYFKAVERQKNKRWKGLVLDIGQRKPKNGSADEKLRFWKATPDKDIPPSLKEEVETEAKFRSPRDYDDLGVGNIKYSRKKGDKKAKRKSDEEVVVDEKRGSDYELYHKTFSDAMQHAYQHAKKKGFIVDPKEIDDKVATGPKKPSSGKTNRYILKTNKKKSVHIQVANLDNKKYELNMYIESHELVERDMARLLKDFPDELKNGLKKAIPGVKLGEHMIKHPRTGRILGLGLTLSGHKDAKILIEYERGSSPSKSFKPGEKIIDIDPKTGKKEVTDTSQTDGYSVWINKAASGIWGKKGEERWVQEKDFRDPKKVVQFLKTKVKRMGEEVEIDEGTALQVQMALSDVGLKGTWKNNKVYVKKRDVKKAEKALKGNVIYKGRPPIVVGENFFNRLREVIDLKKSSMGAVIKDFQDSDAPQFKGKSDKKRKEMAIAAKLDADRNEETDKNDDPKSKKKDKINLKPKMDEKMAKSYKKMLKDIGEKKSTNKEVKEAVTDSGVEYGEQDWDTSYRLDHMAPNLGANYAEFHEQGLEGPYQIDGGVYFFDRKVGSWYSVESEDYVDDDKAKELSFRYVKDGMYKPQFSN